MNRQITNNEIELAMNSQQAKSRNRCFHRSILPNIHRRAIPYTSQNIPKNFIERIDSELSLPGKHHLIWKPDKGSGGGSQDGGGIGRGGHFLFYKFIERTTERWTKFTKQSLQNNFWSLAADIRRPEKQPIVFKGREKNLFFFFLFFCFSSIFFSFLSFLLLVFLSYFLLKSSNTPLLCLNFHFHLTITLQKKEKKKKRERSSIFKLNSIYISKFWVFVFVFKYFISKSLTSAKFFNLCLSVCDINYGHLRI